MAKKCSIEKNLRRMRLVKRYSAKRAQLKAIIMNRAAPIEDRFAAMMKLAKVARNSAAGRVRLRCTLTGRPRGNYRKFKLCRIALRDLASRGQISGMVKASW